MVAITAVALLASVPARGQDGWLSLDHEPLYHPYLEVSGLAGGDADVIQGDLFLTTF